MLSALFPDVRTVDVIEFFLTHDRNEQNQKDLCEALHIYSAAMSKILHHLEWLGLIRETRRIAKSRFFTLNKGSKLIEPLRILMDEFNHEYSLRMEQEQTHDFQ